MDTVQKLFTFIEKSPSPFHAIENMKQELEGQGYIQLLEGSAWKLEEGGNYYVIRNSSAIIAFRIPK